MIYATRIHTSGTGSSWYEVPLSDLTAELLEYFENRLLRNEQDIAMKKTKFISTVFTEESVKWCTQFEFADVLSIELGISKAGNPFLKCSPEYTLDQRREMVIAARNKFRKSAPASASAKIEIDADDTEL
jgi:hypothetical protein